MPVYRDVCQYDVELKNGDPVGHYYPGETVKGQGMVQNNTRQSIKLQCEATYQCLGANREPSILSFQHVIEGYLYLFAVVP